jgi:CRP-like cAMP-binding protein
MGDVTVLRDLELFADCSPADLALISASAEELAVEPGELVVREGRYDHEFYVILDGVAAVTRGGSELARLGPGGFFGVSALLSGQPRNASVTASTEMRLLVVPEETFRELVSRVPSFAAAVDRAGGGRAAPVVSGP